MILDMKGALFSAPFPTHRGIIAAPTSGFKVRSAVAFRQPHQWGFKYAGMSVVVPAISYVHNDS
jgi:hypothetical protein